MSNCLECNDTGFILENHKDKDGITRTKAKFCYCITGEKLRISKEKKQKIINDKEILF